MRRKELCLEIYETECKSCLFLFCAIVRFLPRLPYHMRFLKFYLNIWQAFLNGRNCHRKVYVIIRQSKITSPPTKRPTKIRVRRRQIKHIFDRWLQLSLSVPIRNYHKTVLLTNIINIHNDRISTVEILYIRKVSKSIWWNLINTFFHIFIKNMII
jgi:hypothetical protein